MDAFVEYAKERFPNRNINIHLAIFIEPYLHLTLYGIKQFESRFSAKKIAPYGKVSAQDVIFLKKSGGSIVGECRVESVWFYDLNLTSLTDIRHLYQDKLRIQNDAFWMEKKESKYATIVKIADSTRIEPIRLLKRDRRGWVVLVDKNDARKKHKLTTD